MNIWIFQLQTENIRKLCDSNGIKTLIWFIDQRNQRRKKKNRQIRRKTHQPARIRQSNRLPQHPHRATFKIIQVWIAQIHHYRHDLHTIQAHQASNMLVQQRQIFPMCQLFRMDHQIRLVVMPLAMEQHQSHWNHRLKAINPFKRLHHHEIVHPLSSIINK